MAQNVAQSIFAKINTFVAATEEKMPENGLFLKLSKNYSKKRLIQYAKIRPIWSPCLMKRSQTYFLKNLTHYVCSGGIRSHDP
jgi:hypothetical protein